LRPKTNLINNLCKIVKDYRSDENNGVGMVDNDRIEKWVNQFDENDKLFILEETNNLIKNRYLSRSEVEIKIIGALKTMAKDSTNISSFLSNSIFLDLQPPGKSQGVILELLKSLIKEKLNFDIITSNLDELNNNEGKHFIYFDDVLCTGNTYYQDIKDFLCLKDKRGQEYYKKILSRNIFLHQCFIFAHAVNWNKKINQLNMHVCEGINNENFIGYCQEDNIILQNDILRPVEEDQNQIITNYKNKINEQVDRYSRSKNFTTNENYFRNAGFPGKEQFFSNSENRKRYEKILLLKGIEILDKSSASKPNIRAFGYSLPSVRNFGFGTICFTWRNVPNNTPLVFWYSIGGFTALFPKKVTGQTIKIMISDFEKSIKF